MKQFNRHSRNFLMAFLGLALLCGVKIASSTAQNTSQENTITPDWKVKEVGPKRQGKNFEQDSPPSSESVIEDQIPAHLPIKVELLNLSKEGFLRNLRVKVTNTSNKPIYHLNLSLLLPDVLSPNGHPIAFPIEYGRTALISFQEPIRPDDVPLLPGESHVLKIPEENLGPFERYAARKKLPLSEIKRVYLIFHLLNFGDKTGFSGTNGARIPNIPMGRY